jgi:hypothetical protein
MNNSMILVHASWQESKTFRLVPTNDACPYVECIFDPTSNVFVIISKIKKQALHMLPKLDEYGLAITGTKGTKQERHKIEVFQEFYVEDLEAVESIIKHFASNADTFDYAQYIAKK